MIEEDAEHAESEDFASAEETLRAELELTRRLLGSLGAEAAALVESRVRETAAQARSAALAAALGAAAGVVAASLLAAAVLLLVWGGASGIAAALEIPLWLGRVISGAVLLLACSAAIYAGVVGQARRWRHATERALSRGADASMH